MEITTLSNLVALACNVSGIDFNSERTITGDEFKHLVAEIYTKIEGLSKWLPVGSQGVTEPGQQGGQGGGPHQEVQPRLEGVAGNQSGLHNGRAGYQSEIHSGAEYHQRLQDHADCQPRLHDQVEYQPRLQGQEEYQPRLQDQVEYQPRLQSQVEYQPRLQSQVEYQPRLQSQVEYQPRLQGQVEYQPRLQDQVEYQPRLQDQVEYQPRPQGSAAHQMRLHGGAEHHGVQVDHHRGVEEANHGDFTPENYEIFNFHCDMLFSGVVQCAQKLATQHGACHALIAFWKNAFAQYHENGKVKIDAIYIINNINDFRSNTEKQPT